MSTAQATIREIRTNFRSVKRKLEAHGEIIITDNGVPSYLLKALPPTSTKPSPLPDYYGRLLKAQPHALSPQQTRQLHEENRGDR